MMKSFKHLLDVSMLIALLDEQHIHHAVANNWFKKNLLTGWSTTPITENGFLKIVTHPKYPNGRFSPEKAFFLLKNLTLLSGHEFWHDTLSMLSYPPVQSKIITDFYLIELSKSNHAKLLTLDTRMLNHFSHKHITLLTK